MRNGLSEELMLPTPSILVGDDVQDRFTQGKPRTATHKFVRDVFFSNLPLPFQKLRTYLWLVVMARTLGPSGYGAWSLFNVTLSAATTLAALNCGSALMRFLSGNRTRHEINQAVSTVLAMTGGMLAIIVLLFVLMSRRLGLVIFGSQHARTLVVLVAAALVFDSLFEEMKNLLRARRLNQPWANLCLARLIPETVATIAAAWILRDVVAVSWTYMLVGLLCATGAVLYVFLHRNVRLVWPSRHIAKKYAKFGLPLLPGVLASTISLGADRFLVGHFLGLTQVGIYSACFAVSALPFFLIGPINDVLFPELSALHDARQSQAFVERFLGIEKFVFGFSVGAAALLVSFPHQLLRITASSGFDSGYFTLAILGVQGIFMAIVMLYVLIWNVRLRVWTNTLFWVGSAIAIVGLDVILLPRMGIAGAAVSQLIATAGGAIVLVVANWNLFRQTFRLAWLAQTGIAFGAVVALAFAWRGEPTLLLQSILRLSSGVGVFVACLFLTRYFDLGDARLLKEALF
jgi:O-antigen/teichoic acid export membrane protein